MRKIFIFAAVAAIALVQSACEGDYVDTTSSGIFTYEGGFFTKDSTLWNEYRPQLKEGVWATYTEYKTTDDYHFLRNDSAEVKVPVYGSEAKEIRIKGSGKATYQLMQAFDYYDGRSARLYCIEDGYFLRDGINWFEYHPSKRRMPWAQYLQYGIDGAVILIRTASDTLAIPKHMAENNYTIYVPSGDAYAPFYKVTGVYDSAEGYDYYLEFDSISTIDKSTDKTVPIKDAGPLCLCIDFGGNIQLNNGTQRIKDKFLSADRVYDNSLVGLKLLSGGLFSLLADDTESNKKEGFGLYAESHLKGERVVTYFEDEKSSEAKLLFGPNHDKTYLLQGSGNQAAAKIMLYEIDNAE